jgi:hypothetical protein
MKMKLMSGLAIICMLMACNDDDDSSVNNTNPAIAEIVNTVNQGTWRISTYTDDGVDETGHFTGYVFTFDDNNVLTATNQVNTYTGTWSVTDSNSNDDSPESDVDFNISFAAPANFAELTDDWDILSRTGDRIRLVDVSGGNGGTDYVTFDKIN